LVGFFLMLFHKSYIIHNNCADYIELCSAPQDVQLDSFIKYYLDFLDLSMTNDTRIGLIGRNEKDENLLGIYKKYASQDKIELIRNSGGSFSMVYFILGSKSAESKHGNLHLSDEIKFLSRKVLNTSLLPTVGQRVGIFVGLSSAHDEYSEYQNIVEKNIINDIIDSEEKGVELYFKTWDGKKSLDRNRLDNIRIFKGKRHFQQHWEELITQNQGYAIAVDRELDAVGNNRDDPSFATQYDNKFLSKKSSSFFDVKELSENISYIFEETEINAYRYLSDPKYCIIAGWDIAITGDHSYLTIKALESGYGENRKTKLLYKFMLNPTMDKNLDSLVEQCKSVAMLIQKYNIKAIATDGSGVGKSNSSYILSELRNVRYYDMDENNVLEIVITSGNRTNILNYYYNRIQSGLELFQFIPKDWYDEETLKRLYMNTSKSTDPKSLYIRFIYEHLKFTRTEVKDKNDVIHTEYRQSEEAFMHDDTISSSALCSYIVSLLPDITNTSEAPEISQNTGSRSGARFQR
jgi:RNA binding exosome subunit